MTKDDDNINNSNNFDTTDNNFDFNGNGNSHFSNDKYNKSNNDNGI